MCVFTCLRIHRVSALDGHYLFDGLAYDSARKIGVGEGRYYLNVPAAHPPVDVHAFVCES